MNLIFLNSLEKRVDENQVKTAQVSICEQQGAWHVLWNEAMEEGGLAQSSWFEGTQWDVMLQVFRERLQEKIKEGYVPLLEGYGEGERWVSSRSRETQMLYHYSELHRNDEVFKVLRQWRKEESSKDGRSAFIVASNRILDMISAFLPHTLAELQQIPGFGENRMSSYGEAVIAITKEYPRETDFPLNWVNERIDMPQFELWLGEQKRLRQETEEAKMAGKRRILEAIALGGDLSSLEKLLSMKRRDVLMAVEDLAKEGYDVDALVELELGLINPNDQQQVQVLFAELGDKYLKPVLFKLYNEQELKGKDVNKTYEWMRLVRLKHRKQAVV